MSDSTFTVKPTEGGNAQLNDMNDGGSQDILFNTGSGNRPGKLTVYVGSTYNKFSYKVFDPDGNLLRDGENISTLSLQFTVPEDHDPKHFGAMRVLQRTTYKVTMKLNPIGQPGPFGVTYQYNPLHTKN